MPIGSDANIPLNTDPSLVPAQPAVSTLVNPSPVGSDWDYSSFDSQPGSPASAPVPMQTPQPQGGFTGILQALGALFSGMRGPQARLPPTGMTALLQQQRPRGQAGAGTNSLGNPYNRF